MKKPLMSTRLTKYKDWSDKLHGGKADNKKPSDFSPKELKLGQEEESEHTDNKHIQTEIAMDHLISNKHYYSEKRYD